MTRKSNKPFLFLVLLLFVTVCEFASCKKPGLVLPPSQSSTFKVYLADSQNNYQAVQIDIQQIFIYVVNQATAQSGWTEIPMTRAGVYDLSNFQNGTDTLIAQSNVPPGIVSQIRLILGNNNSLLLNNGLTVPLQISSSSANGIQLNIQDTLFAGKPFSLGIDFNAENSITGPDNNGQYTFQPVVTVFSKSSPFTAKGMALPDFRRVP